jgi:hypothetical protein
MVDYARGSVEKARHDHGSGLPLLSKCLASTAPQRRSAARALGAPDIREDGVTEQLFCPSRLALRREERDHMRPVLPCDRSQVALGYVVNGTRGNLDR